MHVQGLGEEARQWIVAIEGLLHRFGVKTEARELELHQRLIESQATYVDLEEIRTEIQEINEKMTTLQGNWGTTTTKLQGFDSEIANVRAQLQSTI